MENYRIGLDIGIGSIGWAVISGKEETARIEDFGVRIFDSGEDIKNKASFCQARRGFRQVRRLERRRSYRKLLLRNHLENIGLISSGFEDALLACKDADVYELKVRGLSEKLTAAELYRCLIHTCNHRGYRDFYENDLSEENEKGSNEGVNRKAVSAFVEKYRRSGLRSVSEFLLESFKDGNFVNYRNKTCGSNEYLLLQRDLLEEEVRSILKSQSKYYPQLNEKTVAQTVEIIFAQRAFEDGPGDKNDTTRRYQGFLATIGKCPFHKEEQRGFRGTVIADVFSVVNTLSQYRFIDQTTGEFILPRETAEELIRDTLENCGLTMKRVNAIAGKYGIKVQKSERSDEGSLGKSVKFMKGMRSLLEKNGEDWLSWIGEEQFDLEQPSRLHRLSDLLSRYQTPKYRREKLKELAFVPKNMIPDLVAMKLPGTANAGYRYMCEAIAAFLEGDIYGNYQAQVNRQMAEQTRNTLRDKLPQLTDEEVRDNPVVFKSINETRKVLNAIVAIYGAPSDVIVEIADELGKSFTERDQIAKRNKEREKANEAVCADICNILGYTNKEDPIPEQMVERYKLFMQQEGKDPYSGEPLGSLHDVLENALKTYEVDHIVPYSLILDNTLNNKILTFARENQNKKQQTPLMYLSEEKGKAFLSYVNFMYTRDNDLKGKKRDALLYPPFNERKMRYCQLAQIYSAEAQELLRDWKSRNINDTRYITRYISSFVAENLKFADHEGKHVFPIKGAVTSRFRRTWLRETEWGDDRKKRDSYLNHAIDAVVIANLTPAYIEIGSDAIKLRQLYYKYRKQTNGAEYREYYDKCVEKMEKYYHFRRDVTARLLKDPEKIPSYVADLEREVAVRFNDSDGEKFEREVRELYGETPDFKVAPHMPVTSHKVNRKFKGCISDANPVKIVERDGNFYKVSRKDFAKLEKKDLPKLYGADPALVEELNELFAKEGMSGEKYLKENGISCYRRKNGQVLRRVSLISDSTVSNFYRKEIGENNYAYLGGMKYYCVEVYKDEKDRTCTRGVRYVDVVKKDKKLRIKASSLPIDYKEHVMYLFPNDYIEITNGKNELKFAGFYKSVFNINQNAFYYEKANAPAEKGKCFTVGAKDRLKKFDISILGRKGGAVACSVPLSLIRENESE